MTRYRDLKPNDPELIERRYRGEPNSKDLASSRLTSLVLATVFGAVPLAMAQTLTTTCLPDNRTGEVIPTAYCVMPPIKNNGPSFSP